MSNSTTSPASTTTGLQGNNASVIAALQKSSAAANAQVASNSALAGGGSGSAGLASNLNMFLKMLTTQLSHQDPLNPTNSSQFTNQLVLYSEVEQGINTNNNLATLINLQSTNQQAAAISYIGQTVETAGTSLPLQNGGAAFNYALASNSSSTQIKITDSTGKTVAQLTGQNTTGTHYMSWNGKDLSGNQLPDGQYNIQVVADTPQGNTIAATTNTYGIVTGVSTGTNSSTNLDLGAVTAPLSSVNQIVDMTQLNLNIKNGV